MRDDRRQTRCCSIDPTPLYQHRRTVDATSLALARGGNDRAAHHRRADTGLRRAHRSKRGRQPAPHDDVRRLPRRRRALRHLVRVRRWRWRLRQHHPAARSPDRRRSRRGLDPPAPDSRDRSGRRPRLSCTRRRRVRSGRRSRGAARDDDRRARRHHPARRRRRGRPVGQEPRLPPAARCARGARLLRRSQPDLHGRRLRRRCGRRPRPGARRRHAGAPDDPD